MTGEPASMICFNEAKIKRLTIEKPLSEDEIKHSRIRVGVDFMRYYKPGKHVIEVIIRERSE